MIGSHGTPFEVGTGDAFIAPVTGELYLSINDNYFPDNSGDWNVSVTLTSTPLTNEAFTQVEAGANLGLTGAITNVGTFDIACATACDPANLVIDGTVALLGSGDVTLDGAYDSITGICGGTLDNVANTISGAGNIGDGSSLTLVNDMLGVIDANSCGGTLTLDTGSNHITNVGTLEASNNGTLDIQSVVDNGNGNLDVYSGGMIDVQNAIFGGTADIANGTLEFDSRSNVGVTFDNGSHSAPTYGELILGTHSDYSGDIYDFTGTSIADSDIIDLEGIHRNDVYLHQDGQNVVVTVDEQHGATETFTLVGVNEHSLDLTSEGGGTLIVDPPATGSSGSSGASVGHGMNFGHDQINVGASGGAMNSADYNGAANQNGLGSVAATGHDNFVFHANADGETALSSKLDHIDFSHGGGQTGSQFTAFNAADAHAAAFDPVHIDTALPSGMDQFHQIVASAAHLH
jgi:hypothetical protein